VSVRHCSSRSNPAADAIVDHHLTAHLRRQFARDQPRDQIGAAAGQYATSVTVLVG
jgi:hypothetical protein